MFDWILNIRLSLVEEEPLFLIRMENQQKNQNVTEWYRCDKCWAMDKNVECLRCHEVEVFEYFELLDIRYRDMNAVTQRFESCLWNSSFLVKLHIAVLQLYLIWTPEVRTRWFYTTPKI